MHVFQKRPLLVRRAMTLLRAHPTPGDRESPSPVSQPHHEQPMPETDLAAIHYKAYLTLRFGSALQQAAGYRFIPTSNRNGAIVQKAAKTLNNGGESGLSRRHHRGDLAGDPTQMHRPTQEKAH